MGRNELNEWLNVSPSRSFIRIGKGKSAHLDRGNDESLCGRLMITGGRIDTIDAANMDNICSRCWKIMEREANEAAAQLPNLGDELHEDEATTKVANNSPADSGAGEEGKAMTTFAERMDAAEYVQVGAGKTPHVKGDDGKNTACGKTPKGALSDPDLTKVCKACLAVITAAYPTDEETNTVATDTETAELTDDEKRQKIGELTLAIKALAEAGEDQEGAQALKDEAESLIGTLPVGDRNDLRKVLDVAFKGGSDVPTEAKAKPAAKKTVAKKVAAPKPDLETKDYKTAEGVSELVTMGAEKIREGVTAHQKASTTAHEVAAVILDMRLRIKNKSGVPDLKAQSQAARDAAGDMYKAAGSKLDGTDEEVRDAVASMVKATQYRMSDLLVNWVRALDNSPEEYAKLFGAVKEAHPDMTPAEAVFKFYNLSNKSALEREKERQAAKRLDPETKLAITAGGGEVPEEPEGKGGEAVKTPGEKVAEAAPEKKAETFVEALTKLVSKFDKSYLETIEDEDEKSKLEGQIKDAEDKLKELRKALI
jgi:hypothetical protein